MSSLEGSTGTSRALPGDSTSLTPDSYSLRDIIITLNDGRDIKIKNLVNSFTVEESLNSPFISATLTIVDATNFFEDQKITGNEKVYIHVSRNPNSEQSDPAQYKLNFRIADINRYYRDAPTKQFYQFKLVSEHVYNNFALKLSKSFKGTIGKLVDSISNDLNITTKDIAKDSQNIIKGIYPNVRPLDAIRWLMKNAYDSGTHYYFYETSKDQKVFFKSYKKLISEDTYSKYEFRPGYINEIGTEEYYEEARKRIQYIDGALDMSQLAQIGAGTYGSTLHTLDIATKKYEVKKFNYSKDKVSKIEKEQPYSTQDKILNKTYEQIDDQKNYYISLNSKAFGTDDNYHAPTDKTILKYESQLNGLKFQKLNIVINGDFLLYAGAIVDLDIIKASDSEHLDTNNLQDKYLSGKYLVESIQHSFDNTYKQRLTLVRDSLGVNVDA